MSGSVLSAENLVKVIGLCQLIDEEAKKASPSFTKKRALEAVFQNEAERDLYLEKEKLVQAKIKEFAPEQKQAKTTVDDSRAELSQVIVDAFPEMDVTDEELAENIEVVKTLTQKIPGIATVAVESSASRKLELEPERERAIIRALLDSGEDVSHLLKLNEETYFEEDMKQMKSQLNEGQNPEHLEGVVIERGLRIKSLRKS